MSVTTKQWTKSDELQRKKFYLAEADGIVMPVPISFHSTTRSLSLPLSSPIYSFCSAAFHFVLYYLLFVVVPLLLLLYFFPISFSMKEWERLFLFCHTLLQLWKMQCLNYICALLHDPNAIIVQFWLVAGTLAQLCCCCSREWKKWTGKSIEINCRLAWK